MDAKRPAWHHDKRTRQERGYGAGWTKLRLVILKRDGYRCRCDECKRTGRLRPANQVDHIVSKAAWLKRWGNLDGCDAPSNLQALHKDCHEAKSIRERGFTQAVRIGADGFPVDRPSQWEDRGDG